MGSACVKEESKVIEADSLVKKEVLPSTDDDVLENGIEVDLKPKGNNCSVEIVYKSLDFPGPDAVSIKSGSSGASRPPTPFSRPVTAAVIVRPKTTTISERAELRMEEGVEAEDGLIDILTEEEPETRAGLQPPKMRRTGSRNSVEAGHVGHLAPLSRHVSRNIAEDDEEILKMKEYMEQKGL